MNIAVFGRTAIIENSLALKKLCTISQKYGFKVCVFAPFIEQIEQLGQHILCDYRTFTHFDEIKHDVDYLLSIGGDGTLLNTVDLVKNSNIPVVGINTGRLGFLANFTLNQLEDVIHFLQKKEYESDHRSLLQIECNKPIFNNDNIALNEFTLQKKDPSAVIEINAYLNDEFLSSYWADGIIVSTPTGSTGYSLSSNGPIIVPRSQSFVITPIAAHNLNQRPIVVPDNSEIVFKIGQHRGNSYATIDSKYWEIEGDFAFSIKKANFTINIIRPPHTTFVDTLRNKLMWGIDNRTK